MSYQGKLLKHTLIENAKLISSILYVDLKNKDEKHNKTVNIGCRVCVGTTSAIVLNGHVVI